MDSRYVVWRCIAGLYSLEFVGTLPANLSQLKNTASQWRVRGPDDRLWSLQTLSKINSPTLFDVARPTTVATRSGYSWTYQYDATDRRLLSITDTYGRAASFSWSTFYVTSLTGVAGSLPYPEAISEITLPDGTKIAYDYDPVPATVAPSTSMTERLTGVRWKNASSAVVDRESYLYEDADFRTALTGIIDNRGTRTATYAYDRSGRAISTAGASGANQYTVEYGISASTDTRRVTNPFGKSAVYNFPHVGSSTFDIQLSSVDGEASSNCVASNSSLTYDVNGYTATLTDEEGRVTSFARDGKGRPTQVTQATGTPDQRVTTVTWHPTFNVPATLVEPGLTTAYTFNAEGRLVSRSETDTTTGTVPYSTAGQSRIWSLTYTATDLLQSIDGPLPGTGDTVSYTYDASGNVKTFTDEVGLVYTVMTVDGRGLPTQMKDPNNVIENLTYDARGRLLTDTVDPSSLNAMTTLDYDATGNISRLTLPNGSWTDFQYDGNNRMTKLIAKGGQSITYSYDAMGNVTLSETRNAGGDPYFRAQSVFDELGRLLRSVKAGSAAWVYGYDKVDNLLTVTDPNLNATTSTYDKLDRLASFADERNSTTTWSYGATQDPISTTDPHTVTTSYVRNGWSEIIQEKSNDIGTIVYLRDQRGKISRRTDARGVISNLSYDNAGRSLAIGYPSETAANVAYTYDTGTNGKGRLTGATDAVGTVARTYDALGRVVTETRVIGSQTYLVSYSWDKAGKLVSMTYPSGRIVTYGRDVDGDIGNVHTSASATSPNVGLAWWVSHTPFGPRHGLLHGNELTDWRTYDIDQRLVTQTLQNETVTPATTLLSRTYGYADKRGIM